MPDESVIDQSQPRRKLRLSFLSFSLRTLLLAVAAVAIFLAGRATNPSLRTGDEKPVGDWKMKMRAGWKRQAVIMGTRDGRYEFKSGATNFNGIYDLQGDRLIMAIPDKGNLANSPYVWQWDGSGWVLIKEKPTTGDPKYLGTKLLPWGYYEQSAEKRN